ncbi:hypothetical protein [Nocardioides sp.]|uniref:hypothetical protein n=1 Tax=Nocardioides sp. TaxID=35761 RepID=UPI00378520D4
MESECVLAERVTHDVLSPGVVDTVDLDHEPQVGPVEVEVVATRAVPAKHLPVGCRQSPPAQLTGDVELAQAPGAVEQVVDDGVEQQPAPIASHPQELGAEGLRPHHPLLRGQGEQVRRLTVGLGPERAAHGCHLDPRARDAARGLVGSRPAAGLADVVAGAPSHAGAARHRDPDPVQVEALQPRRDE